ncbi:MAG: ATP-binding protein [Eggerthellaceae bacterium]|nr:ATP-binding protein [Eggerthellaceae bacterium]
MPYERSIVNVVKERINEPRRFIQIVIGPRQTGKTTAVAQALAGYAYPHLAVEATKNESGVDWLRAQWYRARQLASSGAALLAIDEVQYVPNWSSAVKTLWDEDATAGIDLRVLLTGSSATLIQEGLDESLTGRFELIESTHWTYPECASAFGYSLDEFLFFGGYPGAAPLRHDRRRWLRYMNASVIEPSIVNDAMRLSEVRNPELMRRLFSTGAPYSGQEVSYRKLLGQLDDRGNTATIAHYLKLLGDAGVMSGLQKYDPKMLRQKASSPRIMVHDTALLTASFGRKRDSLLTDSDLRGRLVETAVGAYLVNLSYAGDVEVFWWREGDLEVDFVVTCEDAVCAIEVKSGRVKPTRGMAEFVVRNPEARPLVVGSTECPLEAFLSGEVELFA